MVSATTISTNIIRLASSLPFVGSDLKRLVRPGYHHDDALHEAYAKFSERYGNAVEPRFDEHFLAGEGAEILRQFADGRIARHEAANLLAETWDNQLDPVRSAVRRRRIADAAMAADSLLRHYAEALK